MTKILKKFTPAELACLTFLAWALIRLATSSGHWVFDPAAFSLATIRDIALVPVPVLLLRLYRNRHQPIPFRQIAGEWRTFLPLYAMILLYPLVPWLIGATGTADADGILQNLDSRIFFGVSPVLQMENWIHPMLSEWMAFSYTFYAIEVLLVFAFLYLGDKMEALGEYVWMMVWCLILGYVGYVHVPAQGPVFTQKFSMSLDLYYMSDIKAALMDATRIERDCFPSLHTAISAVCLFTAWKHLRTFFWVTVPMMATIPFACIYLRYHYAVDVLAGLLLAGLVIAFRRRSSWQA